MDGNDVSIVAVKGARHVQRLTFQVRHEQRLGVGLVVGILLNHVAARDDVLQVGMRDSTQSHSLLRVPRDEVAILLYSPAQGGHIELGHFRCPRVL